MVSEKSSAKGMKQERKHDVDDIHGIKSQLERANKRLKESGLSPENIKIIERFLISLRREGLSKNSILWYTNYMTRCAQRFQDIGIEKPLTQIDQDDFDRLLIFLEDERNLTPSSAWSYKKLIKKFLRWAYDGNSPNWVTAMKLKKPDTPVQPSDLLTKEEVDKLFAACRHPRDKALIAVMTDGGLRVGALASCRIKNLEFGRYGATIYLSKTGQSNKSTPAKGIPLTWSTGFLNQWLAVHPDKENPEAPLWVTLDRNQQALTYKTIRKTILEVAKRAGIKKPVNPHSFRHLAITNWILDGLNEQEVKHRAGWSKGSVQMFKIYGNFTDGQINDRIYEKYGLKTEDKRHVTLKACPRCSNILKPEDKFCSQCSLVLDLETAKKVEKENIEADEKLSPILESRLEELVEIRLQEMLKQKLNNLKVP